MVEAFDRAVSAAVVHALSGSQGFDWGMRLLVSTDLLRLGPMVALLTMAWVWPCGRIEARPEHVFRSLVGIVAATMASMALQNALPARPRPRYAPDAVAFPDLGHLYTLTDWSSFPSDTGTLVFVIVASIAAVSRPLAWAAAFWGTFVICFPRLYFGYHYLSDLVAGAALGFGVMAVVQRLPLLREPAGLARRFVERHPALAVAGLVLFGYELITVFSTLRQARTVLRDILHALSA
jgi:undecaprenyl-diphosphatase